MPTSCVAPRGPRFGSKRTYLFYEARAVPNQESFTRHRLDVRSGEKRTRATLCGVPGPNGPRPSKGQKGHDIRRLTSCVATRTILGLRSSAFSRIWECVAVLGARLALVD
jgi:hypothetical protein